VTRKYLEKGPWDIACLNDLIIEPGLLEEIAKLKSSGSSAND
jgi:hypothetical protein